MRQLKPSKDINFKTASTMRKFKFLVGFLFSSFFLVGQQAPQLNLMPIPERVEATGGEFLLTKDFKVAIQGDYNDRIFPAASRFLVRLKNRTGIFMSQGFLEPDSQESEASFNITISRPGEVKFGEDESYELSVSSSGVDLNATTDIGALRGLETLLQLVTANENGYNFPGIKVTDSPRFPWRGLMIDVARHFHPVEDIKRNIDGMAAVKMNVLHLHLSDDQGFRVESKLYPDLTIKGSDGLFFTQDQIKDIVEYADQRGIRVYPEFDVPGHATAILAAYPQYASKDEEYEIERAAGIFHPTLDPTNAETYTFLNSLFTEMAGLFKDDYFHIGGDENEGKHWDENEEIQKFMKKNKLKSNPDLQAYFNQKLLKNFQSIGKKMIGWDEIMHPDLPKDAVIQSWRGLDAMEKAAKNGYKTMLSNGFYIDLLHSASDHYSTDPLPDTLDLNEEERKNIIGGEATMWGELVISNTVDSRIWPRTAAIAERLWSSQNVRDEESMYKRMSVVSIQLEQLGLRHNSSRDIILRGMSQQYDVEPLKILTNVSRPLQGYARNPGGHVYHSYSPFMLFADACIADPPDAYDFNKLVNKYTQNTVLTGREQTESDIKEYLTLWSSNHAEFMKMSNSNPILQYLNQHSASLSNISTLGIQAIDLLNDKEAPSEDWIEESKVTLTKAREQGGRTELQVVDAIESLINAAYEAPNLKK